MGYTYTPGEYLEIVVESIDSMCGLITGNSIDVTAQYDIIEALTELEQATTEFIDRTGFDSEFPEKTKKFREKLLNINRQLIRHAEKIQSQNGINFDELLTALKLESEALKEEIRLS